jgi:hypothetical protein
MRLSLSRNGHVSTGYQNCCEYTVLENGRSIGRIFQRDTVPELRWFWSLTTIGAYQPGIHTHGRASTIEAATADFQANYQRWLVAARGTES